MEPCDFCGAEFVMAERHVALQPRPSDPTDLCAVMWGCGKCEASSDLPKASDVYSTVEATGQWGGQRFMFVTI